jgi:hypothetical protein
MGDKTRFRFVNSRCIGRTCWAPGYFQHRSPLSCGGSRNTGSPDTPCCLNNAYRGCPSGPDDDGLPIYDAAVAAKRRKEGWTRSV